MLVLKLIFIKESPKEQKHFCLHQLVEEEPLNCEMCMKITFHSKKHKRVERKRAGRGATERQSAISVYEPFNFDQPPRQPRFNLRKPFQELKQTPEDAVAASSSSPAAPSLAGAP